jgi:hypothetical protein
LTALSENYDAERKDGILVSYLLAAGACVYKGAMVALNASGYAAPAADQAGLIFAGFAYEKADNSAGADGDVAVRVWKDGSFRVALAAASLGDLGHEAYVADDNTVALSSTNSISAGTIVEIPASDAVRVLIRGAAK